MRRRKRKAGLKEIYPFVPLSIGKFVKLWRINVSEIPIAIQVSLQSKIKRTKILQGRVIVRPGNG